MSKNGKIHVQKRNKNMNKKNHDNDIPKKAMENNYENKHFEKFLCSQRYCFLCVCMFHLAVNRRHRRMPSYSTHTHIDRANRHGRTVYT